MKPFYKSKKVWVAIIGAAVVIAGDPLSLTLEQQAALTAICIALLGAIMGADWGKEAVATEQDRYASLLEKEIEREDNADDDS